MILLDANVLIYAHRQDAPSHLQYLEWFEGVVNGAELFGVSDSVLSTVIRVVTHPQIFKEPSSIKDIMTFIEQVRSSPRCLFVSPGPKHWNIFIKLIQSQRLTGNAIPDAFLAALAMEWGYVLVSTDKCFSRYPSLNWRHPFTENKG